jgi:hypothetical protein
VWCVGVCVCVVWVCGVCGCVCVCVVCMCVGVWCVGVCVVCVCVECVCVWCVWVCVVWVCGVVCGCVWPWCNSERLRFLKPFIQPTPINADILSQFMAFRVVNKSPALYGTKSAPQSAVHKTLLISPRLIKSLPVYLRLILILTFHIILDLPSRFFPSRLPLGLNYKSNLSIQSCQDILDTTILLTRQLSSTQLFCRNFTIIDVFMIIKQTHSSALDGGGWPASGRGIFTSGTGLRSFFYATG